MYVHTYAGVHTVNGITVYLSFYCSVYITISTSVLQHPFLICIFLFAVHILCQINCAGVLTLRMRRQNHQLNPINALDNGQTVKLILFFRDYSQNFQGFLRPKVWSSQWPVSAGCLDRK